MDCVYLSKHGNEKVTDITTHILAFQMCSTVMLYGQPSLLHLVRFRGQKEKEVENELNGTSL
jgi:hypothetical protein